MRALWPRSFHDQLLIPVVMSGPLPHVLFHGALDEKPPENFFALPFASEDNDAHFWIGSDNHELILPASGDIFHDHSSFTMKVEAEFDAQTTRVTLVSGQKHEWGYDTKWTGDPECTAEEVTA